MRVLLTRPAGENARIARALEALGAECLAWPLSRIVPVGTGLSLPPGTEAILFTSANAVRAFAGASAVRDLPVLCVGDRTAACAKAEGFAEVTSAGGNAADLCRLAGESGHRRFLHARGREAGALSIPGAEIDERVVYAAEPAGPPPAAVADALGAGAVDVVTVWSARNAAILGDWLAATRPPLGSTTLLGISAAALVPLCDAGFAEHLVAARPDAGAMVERIAEAMRQ